MNDQNNVIPPHKSRFYVKCSEYRKLLQSPGTWSYEKVEIFDKEQNDQKIGEYIRNYPSSGEQTFFPFKNEKDEWFALYSQTYHRTYVMSLPDCKKIAECTSERTNCPDSSGFCPVQYWVPSVCAWEMTWDKKFQKKFNKPEKELIWKDTEEDGEFDENYNKIKWHHLDFGFVYGCYWGGPFFIQKIDLSNLESGKVKISNCFDGAEVSNKIKDFSKVIEISVHDRFGHVETISVNGTWYDLEKDN